LFEEGHVVRDNCIRIFNGVKVRRVVYMLSVLAILFRPIVLEDLSKARIRTMMRKSYASEHNFSFGQGIDYASMTI